MNFKALNAKLFEPRRIRENTASPGSVEGNLARQLRILSDTAPIPQLRRHSSLPRRRRYVLMGLRFAAMVLLGLAVTGAAAAAAYVVREVWPSPAAEDRPKGLRISKAVSHPTLAYVDPSTTLSPQATAEPDEAQAERPASRPVAPPPTSSRPAWIPAPRLPAPAPTPQTRPPSRKSGVPATTNRAPEQAVPASTSTMTAPSLTAVPVLPADSPTSDDHKDPSYLRTDGVSEEARLLRQALSALRRDRAPRRALALLDEYDRRFGHGILSLEATSARAQALLKLGDNTRALALLDRLPLSHDGHTGELRVIRGELRSLADRCQDALGDFDAVLHAPRGIDRDELARALFGRASCRARTGDATGAESDRRRYLREFPDGPAVRHLGSQP